MTGPRSIGRRAHAGSLVRRLARVVPAAVFLAACGGDEAPVQEGPTAPAPDPDLEAWVARIPDVEPPVLDRESATFLVTLPLACVDRPQSPPDERPGYLDDRSYTRRTDYEKTRAFYGCYDWHSAVNSTWTMAAVLRRFPDLPVAPLIREKLNDHLKASALEGEEEFFDEAKSFERPYGWAWLLRLHQEVTRWDDEDAPGWAENLVPLARTFAGRMPSYLDGLAYPIRVGTHANTAFSLEKMLRYARAVGDDSLETAVTDKVLAFFRDDRDCPVAYEPSGSDFLSPCLEEAKLMTEILEPETFAAWYRDFMPPVNSPEFGHVLQSLKTDEMEVEEDDRGLQGARAHLLGLAFTRADAMTRIGRALPDRDPTAVALKKLAALQAREGYEGMFDADYLGTHWIASFAVSYLIEAGKGGGTSGPTTDGGDPP